MKSSEFRTMALSFPGTEENPHFDRAAFKVIKKRIFATLHESDGTANLKLLPADQRVFCAYNKKIVYPVPNKWGQQGWTTFELKQIPAELMLDALNTAYQDVVRSKKK
jgi:hypothetical protein